MITVNSVSNPRATRVSDMIDVDLDTQEYGVIPCSLHPEDRVVYYLDGADVTNGDLYRRVQSGEFGSIATYAPPA